jgi:transposase
MQGISGVGQSGGRPPIGGMQPPMGGSRKNETLTDTQKTQLEEILAEYDAENLTEEDAKSIFEQIREAGIQPSKALKETVETAGFDLEKFKPTDRPSGPPPSMSGSKSESMNLSSLQSLQTILNQFDLNNLSAEDEESLFSQIQGAGLMQPGNLFNLSA